MKKIFQWIWAQICAAYNWIVAQLNSISRDKLWCLIMGLLLGAFSAIVLRIEWAWVPVAMIAFIKEFINLWRERGFDVFKFLAATIGGLLIWVFQLIS